MLNKYFDKFLYEISRRIKKFFFLRIYRRDTPESTWKFYNRMRFIYKSEFVKRKNYSKSLNITNSINMLEQNGFAILNLSDISNKKEFIDTIIKFRKKFDNINQNQIENTNNNSKRYIINYNFEFTNEVKIIADPFIDIVTKYLGTLPILDTFQMWYSPNNNKNLNIKKILDKSNVIVVTASSFDGRKILNKSLLKVLRKKTYIINTSRFFSVDENEIIKKLKTGSLLGYATDSIDGEYDKNIYRKNKFIKLSKKYNIIITPHLGGFTHESLNKTEEIMANFFFKNYKNKL